MRLAACDTTPCGDVAEMARREGRCFEIVIGELSKWLPPGGRIERAPIDPDRKSVV